jgi:2,4-dienoyl-CoA reductase-like NADH-dependent reductase (Old Yellow Enzyme family)
MAAEELMADDVIFSQLKFRNLTVRNRIFRSNISGRFDNYDGSGSQARINWEEKFAKGGAGAIISSFVPVKIRGRIIPGYATIDHDERIPFWRKVGEKVHEYDCRFIMQLSHSGRQQDIGGIENLGKKGLSSTNSTDSFHGLPAQAMTTAEIHETVQAFAAGARRARAAGLDGVELHSANGYLINQFLSSGINDRTDEYGGSLENRARFIREIVKAIRQEVGSDFHLQAKISAVDYNNAVIPFEKPGNTLADSMQICKWLEDDGVDAIHVSSGSIFPHPLNPPGIFPIEDAVRWYDIMLSSGNQAFRNYVLFKFKIFNPIFLWVWNRLQEVPARAPTTRQLEDAELAEDFRQFVSTAEMQKLIDKFQGRNLHDAAHIKANVNIPVICTGGFQQASLVRQAIESQMCDGVSMARMLIANNNLPQQWQTGQDLAERPCTYCNKCLLNVLENPLGCYDERRFNGDRERLLQEVLTVFKPGTFD